MNRPSETSTRSDSSNDVVYTSVFSKILRAYKEGVQYIIIQGGASASKTISTLQFLKEIGDRHRFDISVVSESIPHLKRGAIKDFINILEWFGRYSEDDHNKTDQIFDLIKSQVEFFSADVPSKTRGPRRDILFINECNNIPYETAYQLMSRTRKLVILDYNPVSEFWVHTELIPMLKPYEYRYFECTYRDNEALGEKEIRDIERRSAIDPNYKLVYGEGKLGRLEGLIFPEVILIDEMPTADKRIHGMDFGFTNDPTTLADIRVIGDDIFLDELLYQTAMTSGDIIRFLKSIEFGKKELVADSSDPKTIAELRRGGFNVHEAVKGPDSIKFGIDLIKTKRIHITKRSVNFIKEQRNYKWKTDRSTGKPLNEPIDFFNHLWDPTRYGLTKLITKPKVFGVKAN